MSVRTVLSSGRDERMRMRALAVAAGTALVAGFLALVSDPQPLVTAVVLGAGIVVAELFVLRWPPAGELPVSYAVFLVVARALDWRAALATIVFAELVSLAADERNTRAACARGTRRGSWCGDGGRIPRRRSGARAARAARGGRRRVARRGCGGLGDRRQHASRRARGTADVLARTRPVRVGCRGRLRHRDGDRDPRGRWQRFPRHPWRRPARHSAARGLVELPAGGRIDADAAPDRRRARDGARARRRGGARCVGARRRVACATSRPRSACRPTSSTRRPWPHGCATSARSRSTA